MSRKEQCIKYLEENFKKILENNLRLVDITKEALSSDIKLTNETILHFMEMRGYGYDKISKRWIILSDEAKINSNINNHTEKTAPEPGSNNGLEKEQSNDEKAIPYSKIFSILSDILSKINDIQTEKCDNTAKNFCTDSDFLMRELLKINSGESKRYEVTLRVDLVNKSVEKFKSRYEIEKLDLSKPSKLFEYILMDYLYS